MEIVINSCFGGFGLSPAGAKRYWELKGKKVYCFSDSSTDYRNPKYTLIDPKNQKDGFMFFTCFAVPNPNDFDKKILWESHYVNINDIERNDPDLVQTVRELGKKANGSCASLTIVEIPDGVDWVISEYDGSEHIAEKHRTWS